MALFLQHKTDDIQWAVWKMEESLDALLALLPDARRVFCEQELNRFVSERRKMEWLSVRVLLYAMLQEDKEIGYSPEPKSYRPDKVPFVRQNGYTDQIPCERVEHIAQYQYLPE